MAAGLPVVATDTGGTAEAVTEGATGFLVPAGRPDAAAAAVVRLARDAEARHRLGTTGRSRLSSEFDIRRMVREIEALYDGALGKRHATSASHLGLDFARH
jgi:glycosyltransferase involved in cell wall biosynthesis